MGAPPTTQIAGCTTLRREWERVPPGGAAASQVVSLVACQSLSPLQPTLAIGRAWPSASGPRALWWWWLLPWCCNPTLALNVGGPWCVHGFEPQHCFRFQLTSQMQLAGSANAPGYCCAKLTLMLLPATRLAIRFLCARMNACHAQLWRRVSRLIDWACVRACGVVWCANPRGGGQQAGRLLWIWP